MPADTPAPEGATPPAMTMTNHRNPVPAPVASPSGAAPTRRPKADRLLDAWAYKLLEHSPMDVIAAGFRARPERAAIDEYIAALEYRLERSDGMSTRAYAALMEDKNATIAALQAQVASLGSRLRDAAERETALREAASEFLASWDDMTPLVWNDAPLIAALRAALRASRPATETSDG